MSQLREYAGKGWQEWAILGDSEDISLSSSPSHSDLASGDITPSSSRASSPPPHLVPKDDVTKLPRQDMHMFGQCPVQDEFTMAVCDSCGLVVKLEAFASHIKLRHGLPLKFATSSHSNSSSARSGRSNKSNVKPCSVDLLKLSAKLKSERSGGSTKSGSSSISSSSSSCPPPSRSKTPTPDKELLPLSVSPSVIVSAAASATEALSLIEDEPMEVEEPEMVSTPTPVDSSEMKVMDSDTSFLTKFGDDDLGSTNTSNVISIPDTDPLPHNMSGDLMAMVTEVTRPMEIADLTPQSSPLIKLQVHQDENSATTLVLAPSSGITTSLQPVSSPFSVSRPPMPTAIVVQSPSSAVGNIKTLLPNQPESYKSLIKPSPGKKGNAGNRVDRKPLREYHPDKHCGVWEGNRNCTRALTCKSHSVLLKRKVEGRCKSFDELLVAHKKAQAALAAATSVGSIPNVSPVATVNVTPTVVTLPTTPVAPSSILSSAMRPGTISLAKPPPHIMFPLTPVQPQQQQLIQQQQHPQPQQVYYHAPKELEDCLHYTTDHPKPLAVCTFGGRRIGGLMFSDRNRLLTRKLVRVAITSAVPGMGGTRTSGVAGFHRIAPRLTLFQGDTPTPLAIVNGLKRGRDSKDHQPTFLLNYNLGGKRTIVGGSNNSGPTTSTVNLSTLQPGVVIPESFQTDIQDFKGGIKFELGSKIKHIHLPAGGDLP